MTATSTEIAAPRQVVFATVTDPTTYPDWLLGARAIRDVDDGWPAIGTAFRHVIGFPPLLVPGSSTSVELVEGKRFRLRAGMGPLGAALVTFVLAEAGPGRTRLDVDERFVAGPAGWSWQFARPLVSAAVWGRNAVSLEALKSKVEAGDLGADPPPGSR